MDSFSQLIYYYIRYYNLTWLFINQIYTKVIAKILVQPNKLENNFVNSFFGIFAFEKGKMYAHDMISVSSMMMWYLMFLDRYSCASDLLYVSLLRYTIFCLPIYLISIVSYSLNFMDRTVFWQQFSMMTQMLPSKDNYYEMINLQTSLFIMGCTVYHICHCKKINKVKCFTYLGICSYILRTFVIMFLAYNNNLDNSQLKNYYNCNQFTNFYIVSISFAVCEKIHKFKINHYQLYNEHLSTHHINQKLIVFMGMILLVFICHVLVFAEIMYEKINNASNIIIVILVKPAYFICCILIQTLSALVTNNKMQSIRNIRLLKHPGCDSLYYTYCITQLINGIIIYFLQQTMMGPYNGYFMCVLIFGIVVLYFTAGYIYHRMFSWTVRQLVTLLNEVFDTKKRAKIKLLIKESQYESKH